jgi:putative transposase
MIGVARFTPDFKSISLLGMEFLENELYHIYNRGNNKQRIFFNSENYLYFLKKVSIYIRPHCDILAYCLMPNHFHFLVNSDKRTIAKKTVAGTDRNILSEGIRNLLSSYTQAINKQNSSTGSLFQQNTKAKQILKDSKLYDLLCFHYIHQNPIKAKLAKKMEDWEFSSFKDYCGLRNGTLANKQLAIQLLDIDMKNFYEDSYKIINDDYLKNIF